MRNLQLYNTIFAGQKLPYPTKDLQVIVYNQTYEDGGTTYLRTSIGVGIPLVSGTGLDAIWDFSVLSDVRLDKSNATYWGASLNDWFYYDALNPYHFKLPDFHYRFFQNQMVSDNNFVFGKFNYIFSKLESISSILIYANTQNGNDLNRLLNYQGILPPFAGEEKFKNGNFNIDLSEWYNLNTSSFTRNTTNPISGLADANINNVDASARGVSILMGEMMELVSYEFNFKYRANSGFGRYKFGKTNIVGSALLGGAPSSNTLNQGTNTAINETFTPTETASAYFIFFTTAISDINFDDFSMIPTYTNFYKGELSTSVESLASRLSFDEDLVAHNGQYMAIMSDAKEIAFSTDSGNTFGNYYDLTANVTDQSVISKDLIRISNNGNVIICCPFDRKILVSTDNCVSFSDVTILDQDDDPLTLHTPANASYPGGYFNFFEGFEIGVINGVEVIVLGNYTNSGLGASPIYLYYSIDGGETFKVFYEFGQNTNYTDDGSSTGSTGGTLLGDASNSVITRHVHSVDFSNGKFIACCGDSTNENWFLECEYDNTLDSWTTTFLNTVTTQRYRALGVYQDDYYYYWGVDSSSLQGLYKTLKSNIDLPDNHIILLDPFDACYGYKIIDNIVLSIMQTGQYIYISNDYGKSFTKVDLSLYLTSTARYIIKDTTSNIFSINDADKNRLFIEIK